MRKILIITLIGITVSIYSILTYANTSNYCPLTNTFDPPSTPAFWIWKTIAPLTPVAFNPQKQYQFYAEFYLNDETSSL